MPTADIDFTGKLEALDLSLFHAILTQSDDGDRRSWLAVQRAVRSPSGYTYLEIGSHLGGSIQQHLPDPWCREIISIDKRPLSQPDDRGQTFYYESNSTTRMLDNLSRVAPDELRKVKCYNMDAERIETEAIPVPPDFCFIDGEHTYAATLSDFEFCLRVCAPNAAICFHDDWIIHRAIGTAIAMLRRRRIPFTARKLEGQTFGIFLRDCVAANAPYICNCSKDGCRWIRGLKFRALVPECLKPALRRVVRRFRA